MSRLITDQQRDKLINYLMSIPSGQHPAGVPFNLVMELRSLPAAPEANPDGSTPAVVPPPTAAAQ